MQNPLLQEIREAARRGRKADAGWVVAEGPHLAAELFQTGLTLDALLVSEANLPEWEPLCRRRDTEMIVLPDADFDRLSATNHAQGVLCLVRPRSWQWHDLAPGAHSLVVVLDGIQDPGNAGTIVRSAEAFGASGVVFLDGSVRLSNGKLIRASAGSLFRMPVLENISVAELLLQSADGGWRIYSLSARGNLRVEQAPFSGRTLLVVGNEGQGVQPALLEASAPLSIRTAAVESLNAGVACSIALFAASNARRAAGIT